MPQEQASSGTRDREFGIGNVRRHIPVDLPSDPSPVAASYHGTEVKGGRRAESSVPARDEEAMTGSTYMAGKQSLFLIVRRTPEVTETPVFDCGDGKGAIYVFSDKDVGQFYLQVARTDNYQLLELTPMQLSQWIQQVRKEGVGSLVVDPPPPNEEIKRKPRYAISLEKLRDISAENLYGEIEEVERIGA